ALVADRRRAREDANRLVTAARAARLSPIELLPRWRADRRLTVEGPALTSLHISEEQSIAIQGEKMALAIRALAQRLSASNGTSIDPLAGGSHPPTSLLTPEAATRLLEIAARRDLPPQGPISVALLINRDSYVSAMG